MTREEEVYLSILMRINKFIAETSHKWESWSYPDWKKPLFPTDEER